MRKSRAAAPRISGVISRGKRGWEAPWRGGKGGTLEYDAACGRGINNLCRMSSGDFGSGAGAARWPCATRRGAEGLRGSDIEASKLAHANKTTYMEHHSQVGGKIKSIVFVGLTGSSPRLPWWLALRVGGCPWTSSSSWVFVRGADAISMGVGDALSTKSENSTYSPSATANGSLRTTRGG